MNPLDEIERTLEGVNLRDLGLDRAELLLHPTWWPSRGPSVERAQQVLNEARSAALLVSGVWIPGKDGAPVACEDEIGRKEGDDNRWAAMMPQSLLERKA